MLSSCSFCGERPAPGSGVVTGPGVAICHACAAIALEVLAESPPSPEALVLVDCTLLSPSSRAVGLDRVERAAVVIRRDVVSWTGPVDDLPRRHRELPTVDCEGRVVVPGLVDAGGWLLGSSHDRRPDPAELVAAARAAATSMLSMGVTTIDVRVGGSGDPVLDTLLLAAARTVGESSLAELVVTWVVSPDLVVEDIEAILAPTACRLASLGLVVDRGQDDLGARLTAIEPLRPRLLTAVKPEELEESVVSVEFSHRPTTMSGVPVVLRPDSLLGFGDASHLLTGGTLPALASGFDPHGVKSMGMGWVMLLAVEAGGHTPDEAVWAATRGSALALGDGSRGIIRPGSTADLVVFDADGSEGVVRRPGHRPWMVMASGVPIRE